jgi:hypothetical protein
MSYDYSKIKKWTAGAPDEKKPKMVLETNKGYVEVGKISYKHRWSYLESDIIRWAWLPGFEPEDE